MVMPNTPFLSGEFGEDEEDFIAADSNTLPSNRQQAYKQ
jgi:hypothetical protein